MESYTFRELFCQRYKIEPSHYVGAVFRRCGYPHARWLRGVMEIVSPQFFSADYELIRQIGICASYDEARSVLLAFPWEHTNSWFSRRRLRIRISTTKLRAMAADLFAQSARSAAA